MNLSHRITLSLVVAFLLAACQPDQPASPSEAAAPVTKVVEAIATNTVEVVAKDFSFHVADELLSGWTTFQLKNEGHATHFFLLNLLPEGVSFEKYRDEGSRVFDRVFEALKSGEADKAKAGAMLGELLPEWFFSVQQMGGTGLIAVGETAQTTLKLEPGRYVMECYIKTPEGIFHTTLGMMRPVTVLAESSTMAPPTPNVELALTNFKYEISGAPVAGKNTVAVHFNEQPEFGLGNDVHVARLGEDQDLQEVIGWMDWMNITGLQSPAPASFLGGAQEMPVGNTAYFTVQLEPGRYAWIAESAAEKGMIESFVVEAPQ